MARNNRIFVSFAIEDARYRDLFCGQENLKSSPFAFIDMSVKDPWDEKWKSNCRSRIKSCDGMFALISKNTAQATGQMWEIACALEERIPVLGIYCTTDSRPWSTPHNIRVVGWTWTNIESFIGIL